MNAAFMNARNQLVVEGKAFHTADEREQAWKTLLEGMVHIELNRLIATKVGGPERTAAFADYNDADPTSKQHGIKVENVRKMVAHILTKEGLELDFNDIEADGVRDAIVKAIKAADGTFDETKYDIESRWFQFVSDWDGTTYDNEVTVTECEIVAKATEKANTANFLEFDIKGTFKFQNNTGGGGTATDVAGLAATAKAAGPPPTPPGKWWQTQNGLTVDGTDPNKLNPDEKLGLGNKRDELIKELAVIGKYQDKYKPDGSATSRAKVKKLLTEGEFTNTLAGQDALIMVIRYGQVLQGILDLEKDMPKWGILFKAVGDAVILKAKAWRKEIDNAIGQPLGTEAQVRAVHAKIAPQWKKFIDEIGGTGQNYYPWVEGEFHRAMLKSLSVTVDHIKVA